MSPRGILQFRGEGGIAGHASGYREVSTYTMDIICLLWQRETKKLFRSWSRLLMNVVAPLAFIILLGVGLGGVARLPGIAPDYLIFLIPGTVAVTVMFTGIGSGSQILWDRQRGFLKGVLVAPVSRMEIVLGHTAGGATIAVFQGLLLLVMSLIVGLLLPTLAGFCLAIIFLLLAAVAFTAFGVAIAARTGDASGLQMITGIFTFLFFGFSGAVFPISTLPAWIEPLTLANPLTYCVEGVRYGLTGMSQIHPVVCLAVMTGFCMVTVAGGAYLFRKMP